MAQQEAQFVVHVGEFGVHHFRRHEVGEHFLGPDIVEPAHGHQVAKPHVSDFVGDQAGPAQQLLVGRVLIQQQQLGPVLDGADMLHAAVLECRYQREVELCERVGNTGVVLQPGNGRAVLGKNGIQVAGEHVGVGFPVQQGHVALAPGLGYSVKAPGDKSKQVGTDRLGDRKPVPGGPRVRLRRQ